MGDKSKVKVVVRVRPKLEADNIWVQVVNRTTLHTVNHRNLEETLAYEFETVFGPESSQLSVYKECVYPMLGHVVSGKNSSVFAYGPTGAGKTHTILGTAEDPGIIMRSIKGLFAAIQEEKIKLAELGEEDDWTFTVSFSYLEIYNEKVQDLLEPKTIDLPIREDGNKNIFVTGLSEKVIHNSAEFSHFFAPASRNRTTASTKLNERSSRSHSLLLIRVQKAQQCPPHRVLTGKLHIIDLAGSEDNRRTGNEGVRLKESGAINTSLLALGQVVDALNKGQPCIYRSSKLTRLLQDSLGGSCHSCMIVNLAPEERHYYDTYTTLNFARKSKKIVNIVHTNETFSRPGGPRCLKREGSPSNELNEPTAKTPRTPTTFRPPSPTPFLSPLLRQQNHFQREMKEEMLTRLESLEERLMDQMKNAINESIMGQSRMDQTTVEDTCVDGSTQKNNTATTCARFTVPETPPFESQVSLAHGRQLLQDIKNANLFNLPVTNEKSESKAKRTKGQYADGSMKENPAGNFPDPSISPFFLKPTMLKRKGFKSTACRHPDFRSPAVNRNSNSIQLPNSPAVFNKDLQRKHNNHILEILNTGSVNELMKLQTVGQKRARLINDWRNLRGPFGNFEDLGKIKGLTCRYITSFLQANLVREVPNLEDKTYKQQC